MKLLSWLNSCVIAAATADETVSLLQHRATQHFSTNTSRETCEGHTKLALTSVTGSLDAGLRYASVTNGVDLVVKPLKEHQSAADSGMLSDFGIVNVLTGTSTEVEMRFVEAGTDNPTVLENIAFSLYDMDEGKKGKGRVSMQLCGPVGAAFPGDSELAVYESDGCYHITSCLRGAKGNEPASVADVGAEGAKRTATFWFERAARLAFKMEVTPGYGGRNFMFAFEPSNACQPNYQVDFLPPSCCAADDPEGEEDCDNAVIDFEPPEPLPIETTTTTTPAPPPGKKPKPFCKAKCPKNKRCCFAKNGKRTVYLKMKDGKYRDKCLDRGQTYCTSTGKKLVPKKGRKPRPDEFCQKKCKKGVRCCLQMKKTGGRKKWKITGKWSKPTDGKKKSKCMKQGGRYCDPKGQLFKRR